MGGGECIGANCFVTKIVRETMMLHFLYKLFKLVQFLGPFSFSYECGHIFSMM